MRRFLLLLLFFLMAITGFIQSDTIIAQAQNSDTQLVYDFDDTSSIKHQESSTFLDETTVLYQPQTSLSLVPTIANPLSTAEQSPPTDSTIRIFGQQIDVGDLPLFLSTFIIAFVDGFNPCSLWVLTFLLGFVAMTGSRKKILIIGTTYLLVSSLVYGLFILGMVNFFYYITYLFWIRVVVALIASSFAIINIKDFFFYKKGVSLTIPDYFKPKIYRQARDLRKEGTSTWSMVVGAAIMALGITLVELPCTAGFPMIWSSIMAAHEIDISMFILLFALYILVYFLDEMLIFISVVLTLKISRFEEKHGRFLKLLGGIIMLALAGVLVFHPILLNDISGTLVLFMVSALLAVIIAKTYDFYMKKKEQNKQS